ncbi:Sbal_3080 family lipoprotein [Pseudomonas syringae group genomosp. 3]|uniref:Sbal_3080 family lipoprotein n=1 Tax=Pseudomonas syringae group genomosp. 3 TaxID=251701 RepID=UPI0005C9A326|nr:Sbal_3080 family lipoprotein [Pseudomonas syringae group genomosp. 3]KPB95298.1 Lipoprotein [Pseudomonas syringae pv. maculicola str. M6]KPX67756.1 putative Lipoprotein [Pseudomonas syringae pv. maculicola]
MRTFYISIIVASAALASGCTINQTVTPVQLSQDLAPEICMIPAEGLREGFNTTYVRLLTEKGFHTRQIPPGSSPSSCPLTTTYIGTWSWDVAIYMSYADIRVYQFGQQVGQAEYDSRWGGGRVIDKFINAEKKITEMTNQLFPKGAAGLKGTQGSNSVAGTSPLTKEAYQQQQLDLLKDQSLPYAEYQKRYKQIMAE